MIKYRELKGKKVALRVAFLSSPIIATVQEVEELGIWISGLEHLPNVHEHPPAIKEPILATSNPATFIPREQIQFVMPLHDA